MQRGEIWWAELPTPVASEPGYYRPVLVIQSDDFNRSRIRTVIVAVLTTNLRLAEALDKILSSLEDIDLGLQIETYSAQEVYNLNERL